MADKDMQGFVNPTSTVKADHDGVIVNSPYNKPAAKYKPAEPLGIQRSGNRDSKDSHLSHHYAKK